MTEEIQQGVQEGAEQIENAADESANVEKATEAKAEGDAGTEEKAETQKSEEQWPKKAVNALSKRDKQIGKLRAELDYMRQQMQNSQPQTQATPQVKKVDASPKASDFEDYESYIDAKAAYQAERLINQKMAEVEKQSVREREQAHNATLDSQFQKSLDAAKASIPDFEDVMADAYDEPVADHVIQAIKEAEDGALAAYLAVKEGLVEKLNQMSPYRAAMEIARLADRAKLSVSKPKPVTKAPNPMAPVRGTVQGSKSESDMNSDELMKAYGFRK